jgi:uncharacterized protein YaaQ
MQAMLAIVQSEDVEATIKKLETLHLPNARYVASSGGFLRQGNASLTMVVNENQVEAVLDVLRATCQRRTTYVPAQLEVAQLASAFPVEVQVGGATVFVYDLERYEEF